MPCVMTLICGLHPHLHELLVLLPVLERDLGARRDGLRRVGVGQRLVVCDIVAELRSGQPAKTYDHRHGDHGPPEESEASHRSLLSCSNGRVMFGEFSFGEWRSPPPSTDTSLLIVE